MAFAGRVTLLLIKVKLPVVLTVKLVKVLLLIVVLSTDAPLEIQVTAPDAVAE